MGWMNIKWIKVFNSDDQYSKEITIIHNHIRTIWYYLKKHLIEVHCINQNLITSSYDLTTPTKCNTGNAPSQNSINAHIQNFNLIDINLIKRNEKKLSLRLPMLCRTRQGRFYFIPCKKRTRLSLEGCQIEQLILMFSNKGVI